MKISMWRDHKVQPEQYESLNFGARVEIDTEIDTKYADMEPEEISAELQEQLDLMLDKPVDRAVRLPGSTMEQSHIWDYYEKD